MPHDDDFDPALEGPSDADIERFGDDAEDRCHRCNAAVYHDLTACPHCGADLDAPRAASGRIPPWVAGLAVGMVILGLLAVTLL